MRQAKNNAVEASRRRQETMNVNSFGNMWEEGDKLHVFYPYAQDINGETTLMIAECYGHPANPKEVALNPKRIFIPTLSRIEKGRYVDKDGNPTEPDFLWFAAKMARLIKENNKAEELLAVQNDTDMSQGEIASETADIVKKYENMQPFIGKLKKVISTECVAVALKQVVKEDDTTAYTVDDERLDIVTQELSDERISILTDYLKSDKVYLHEDLEVIEVIYNFPKKNDKKLSGRQKPEAIHSEEESALKKFPKYRDAILTAIKKLPNDDEIIANRNKNFHTVPEAILISSLTSQIRTKLRKVKDVFTDVQLTELASMNEYLTSVRLQISDKALKAKYEEKVAEIRKKKEEEEKVLKEADKNSKPPTIEELEGFDAESAQDIADAKADDDFTEAANSYENM